MTKIIKLFTAIKNNWKKITFAITATGYGVDYAHTEYEKNSLVRKYCKVASEYGDSPLDVLKYPRHVAVILNPAANKRKAQKEYEKYCAPLLHLAGIKVTLLVTNKDADATSMISKIPADANAILIAGGDGTISEVITGLLRTRNDSSLTDTLPIGILPVGRTNSLAQTLYIPSNDVSDKIYRFHVMLDATYSIIYEVTKQLHVMEIKSIEENKDDSMKELKPIYAINCIHFGPFRDALARRESYWYFEKLRSYAVYMFGSFDRDKPVQATLKYTPPCSGCAKCYKNRSDLLKKTEPIVKKLWWTAFVPRFQKALDNSFVDYSIIENLSCGIATEIPINSVEVHVSPMDNSDIPALKVKIGPERISYFKFIREGWTRIKKRFEVIDNTLHVLEFDAQNLYFAPLHESNNKTYFSIDNEEFELKKMNITLLNNVLSIFHLPRGSPNPNR